MRRLSTVCVLSTIAIAGSSAQAANILHFRDANAGTNVVPGAIVLSGNTEVAVSNSTHFNTQLALGVGVYPIAIFGHHGHDSTDDEVAAALSTYIGAGGRVIAATFEIDIIGQFEASFAGQNAYTITTDGHPIFAGLGPTIGLLDLWITDNQYYNGIGGGVCLGTLGTGCAAILGNGGRTILNGPLFDTYSDQAQGKQYIANQIGFLMGSSAAIPEPGTYALLGGGLLLLRVFRSRLRKK